MADEQQCQGTTADGDQCKRQSADNSAFCSVHRPEVTPERIARVEGYDRKGRPRLLRIFYGDENTDPTDSDMRCEVVPADFLDAE